MLLFFFFFGPKLYQMRLISLQINLSPRSEPSGPVTQSTGALEYSDCITAKEWDPLNEYHEYDTKQSDDVVHIILELWGIQYNPYHRSQAIPDQVGKHLIGYYLWVKKNCLNFKLSANKKKTLSKLNHYNRTVLSFKCV